MKTKDLILKLARVKGEIRSQDVLKRKKISRQTLAQHFRELIAADRLEKIGSTRNARYRLADKKSEKKSGQNFSSSYRTRGLSEDRVFDEAKRKLRLPTQLSEQALRILNYAFTEMLNNAIEHSKAPTVKVEITLDGSEVCFRVMDHGVGAFENMRRKFGLKDHFEAVEFILKGKQTTDPKHHTGQGIFFTSKAADRFALESGKLKLSVDNRIQDSFLADIQGFRGTRVTFVLKRASRKDLKSIFDEYSETEYEFDKTRIVIRLLKKEGEYVSRSEARRLLIGLDQFKKVILDFKDVRGIGQGFADEVFRVFRMKHPEVQIEAVHASESVIHMMTRAQKT